MFDVGDSLITERTLSNTEEYFKTVRRALKLQGPAHCLAQGQVLAVCLRKRLAESDNNRYKGQDSRGNLHGLSEHIQESIQRDAG